MDETGSIVIEDAALATPTTRMEANISCLNCMAIREGYVYAERDFILYACGGVSPWGRSRCPCIAALLYPGGVELRICDGHSTHDVMSAPLLQI